MLENHRLRVLITYPNLSMMLTPSYAVGLFSAILKTQGYEVDMFDCTAYRATHEFLHEPLPVTRANKMLNSRKFNALALFGEPKTDLIGDYVRKIEDFKPHVVILSTVVEDTWPQAKELLEVLSHYPEIKSLIGGVLTTMAPDFVMQYEHVKCMGVGEGEETVVDFCESVRAGVEPTTIHGT